MLHQMISAGFGGQGVLLLGQLLAYSGMEEGKHVSWLPSYGPEMRGGTANCSVIISDDEICAPNVTAADAVVVMNRPSLDKYEKCVKPGGKLFINSSLIEDKAKRTDIDVYYIPANEIADQMGNSKVANIVMLGAYLKATDVVRPDTLIKCLEAKLGAKKAHLIPLNEQAMKKGASCID